MNTIRLGILALLFSSQYATAQNATLYDEPLSERRVEYMIDATLDVARNSIIGSQTVLWRNPDTVAVGELQFHLYLNAFRNPESTFMVESGGMHRDFSIRDEEDPWGGIDILSMKVGAADRSPDGEPLAQFERGEEDLMSKISFIPPDDGNSRDSTVIVVPLDTAVRPGEVVAIDIGFVSRLPKIFARTGWDTLPDGSLFYMVAQWFPKLGVYEVPGQRYVPQDAEKGAWSTHQFHMNSEFYADFGNYNVSMTVPRTYVVGATGVYIGTSEEGANKTIRYEAKDVHDFAWTTSPAFVEETDSWRHVNMKVLLLPDHVDQAERHFGAAKNALEWFDENMGEYPYTTLTLVDGLGGANGMEYPTLITCGTFYNLPERFRTLEVVTIHEFGHQYFYGMLASNEAEEAWLDEGMNSYAESVIMDSYYGEGSVIDIPGAKIGGLAGHYLVYVGSRPAEGALNTRSWEYPGGSVYGRVTYSKSALVMHALANVLGEAKMKEFLQSYYHKWRFRHPTTRDLVAVAEDVAGRDLTWFFSQFVYGTAIVDYAVESIASNQQSNGTFTSGVVLARLSDGLMPQSVRVTFADGSQQTVEWNGLDETHELTFEHAAPVAEVFIDPSNETILDVNRLNNRRVQNPNGLGFATKYKFKAAVFFQQLLGIVSAIL